MANQKQMTIVEHLEELRGRLIKCLVALAITTALAFACTSQIMRVLIAPAGIELVFLRPTEMFVTYFRVALLAGVVLAMPVIVYQAVRFTLPGLRNRERAYLRVVVPGATFSFILGVAFAYYVMLPLALRYLLAFGDDLAAARWAISEYASFVTRLLFWSGVVFQIPMLLFFLARLQIVTPQFLSENRKFAVLVVAVVAAVITPTPDPFNMVVVMFPLLLMYETGVLLAKLACRLA